MYMDPTPTDPAERVHELSPWVVPETITRISHDLEDVTDIQGLCGAERDRSQLEPLLLLRSNAPLQSTAASLRPSPDIVIELRTVPVGYDFDRLNDLALSILVHMLELVLDLLMPNNNAPLSDAKTTFSILPEKPALVLHDPPPSELVNRFDPVRESVPTTWTFPS